jgi:hypothetical protein
VSTAAFRRSLEALERAGFPGLLLEIPGQLELPESRSGILRVNGPSVHIRDTPAHLRVSNSSGFEAAVTITAGVSQPDTGYHAIKIDGFVSTARLDGSSVTTVLSHDHYLKDSTKPGVILAEWFVFQEARRLKRKGSIRYGFGPASFKFQLFTPAEI